MRIKHYMTRIILVCIFFALANYLIAQTATRNSDVPVFPKTISVEDKVYIFSTIWSEIKYNFVNIDQITFNPDSLYRATLPLIINSQNDIAFNDELEKFICSFGDGHTELTGQSYAWNEYMDYIPIGLSEFQDQFYITSVRKNTSLDSTFLGARIIEIEGVPALEYIKKNYYPFIASSTPHHKLFLSRSKIGQGTKYTFFKCKVLKQSGEEVNIYIQRNGESTRTKNDQYWRIKNAVRSPSISLEWKDKIALLKINSFRENVIPEMDSLMKIVISKAKGLIIDLRKNGGGITDAAWQLQKYLTKGDYFLSFGAQTRINNGYGKSQGNYRKEYENFYKDKAYETIMPDTILVEKTFKRITCPVVILIGNYTFSAAEDFLVNIYELPDRPLLVGEKTAGSSGAPLLLSNLPHEMSARICTLRELFPYSLKPFVKTGILPDIEIKESLEDFINDVDVVSAKAIQLIENKTSFK